MAATGAQPGSVFNNYGDNTPTEEGLLARSGGIGCETIIISTADIAAEPEVNEKKYPQVLGTTSDLIVFGKNDVVSSNLVVAAQTIMFSHVKIL